jgi:hypothetical protein
MERLGKQLETAQKTFTEVEGTRNRQLTRVVEQISSRSAASLTGSKKTKHLKLDD